MEVDLQEANGTATQLRRSRKRPPPSDDEDEEDINERLLPAAAAMKRRRIEEEKQAQRRGVSAESSLGTTKKNVEVPSKKPKPRKEVNIQEVVRERREAEEEAARRDEETLTLDGADIESMRNLAVVEEMELPDRQAPSRRQDANGARNERWDERWNGRKNFKKFHRSGDGEPRRRGPSVIVALEEVKKKSQGIGEEYWLESDKAKKKRKEKENEENEPASPMMDESELFTTARSRTHTQDVPAELVIGEEAEVVDVDAPRLTRGMDASSAEVRASQRNGKRPAPAVGRGGSAKKQKVLRVEEGSDSEDDLKFRFKKRR